MHNHPSAPPPSSHASLLSGLGQALRWLREKQSRKQYRVADTAGITKGMLSAYETGRQRPSLETLDKLLETLGCDLNDLHNALQIVNGRPERIKSWRGWQTSALLSGNTWPEAAGGWPDRAAAAERPAASTGAVALNGLNGLGGLGGSGLIGGQARFAVAGLAGSEGGRGGIADPRFVHAVSEVREPIRPYGSAWTGAELDQVLGSDRPRLAAEEEQALGQMLEGFHGLLRYWHRSLALVAESGAMRQQVSPEPAAPPPGSVAPAAASEPQTGSHESPSGKRPDRGKAPG